MNKTKKRIIIITSLVVLAFIIMSVVYAIATNKLDLTGNVKTGSVEIETLNLTFKKSNGEDVKALEPADIGTISWTTKNIGTSGILTRHTLEIYWNDDVDEKANSLLYLYPANMSKEAILRDYENGEKSEYLLKTEKISKPINGKIRYGFKYTFIGDILDGTDMSGVSKEVNYNISNLDVIDANIKTDDSNKVQDEIAFRLLLSPKTSYLYQNKAISVKVVTEAMQYTEDEIAEWKVVDTQEIQ